MSDGWAMKSIGELCEAPKLRKAEVGTVPYIEIGDVDVVSKLVNLKDKPAVKGSVLAPASSLLVSRVRPTRGAITLLNSTQAVSSAFLALQPKAGTNLRLLFYWLAYSDDFRAYLEGAQIGALYPSVREEDILKYRVNYPSDPAEQQRIVRLLDEAFEGIATAKDNAEKNLQNAHELLNSHLQALFGQVDHEWREVQLEKLCTVDWGNTKLTKSAYVESGEYLAVSAAGCDGRIDHKEHAKFTPVLSAIGAQCGRMFLPDEDFTAIKNTITLTPKDGTCTGKFLYRLLTYVELPKRGAAQPFISKGDIQTFSVNVPPLTTQKRVVELLDKLEQHTDELAQVYGSKLAKLDALKHSLLHQAFTGDFKVLS